MSHLSALQAELKRLTDPAKATFLQRFFKTGPGQYSEGDKFRGITLPVQRALVKAHPIGFDDAAELLESEWHEDRLVALIQFMAIYSKAEGPLRNKIHKHYLSRVAER
ncbi:MAG TPA: DNA alkylation repair protein, partial [Fibrobacteria bacterium]|nr:DNA alkylation repair protein [Fibrobacteria bacterium]